MSTISTAQTIPMTLHQEVIPEPEELTLDEIMSRVAEIKSGWCDREKRRRRFMGMQRRQQLAASLNLKCA